MDSTINFERRFSGIARLYGQQALANFQAAHICVIGVGGVGSWVVEALARSAIGKLTLIDLDNVAESNINRQIQALTHTLGQAKVSALTERIAQINPLCDVVQVEDFITPDNVADLIQPGQFDYVVDAIDQVKAKVALLAWCRAKEIPIVTIGAAGGQIDPGKITVRDLCQTEQEPLLALVKKRLRSQHGFPRGAKNKFGIDAVFSMESIRLPDQACAVDEASAAPVEAITGLNCAGFGSTMVVTATFGLHAADWVLRSLAGRNLSC
jgi:tRNA A37 threonylcarbamoyladenosine dehydratase